MRINKNIELRHLRYFIAVAEELHFGRAAARLGIAQPPLSQQIQRLETLLGTQLLSRTSRQVSLTEAGRVFLEGAKRTIAQFDVTVEETHLVSRGERGIVTVAFAASVMFQSLPRFIREFRIKYPDVHLELREMSTGPQLEALFSGEIDVGFCRQPRHDGTTLEVVSLIAEPLLIALNANHPLAGDPDLKLQQLAHDDFVLFPEEVAPGLYANVFEVCREAGFKPHVIQESRELYTTVSLVEAGVGVTIVPASVQKMGWTDVVYRPIRSRLAQCAIEIAWRKNESSPVVKSFVDLILDRLKYNDETPMAALHQNGRSA